MTILVNFYRLNALFASVRILHKLFILTALQASEPFATRRKGFYHPTLIYLQPTNPLNGARE